MLLIATRMRWLSVRSIRESTAKVSAMARNAMITERTSDASGAGAVATHLLTGKA